MCHTNKGDVKRWDGISLHSSECRFLLRKYNFEIYFNGTAYVYNRFNFYTKPLCGFVLDSIISTTTNFNSTLDIELTLRQFESIISNALRNYVVCWKCENGISGTYVIWQDCTGVRFQFKDIIFVNKKIVLFLPYCVLFRWKKKYIPFSSHKNLFTKDAENLEYEILLGVAKEKLNF